MSKDAFDDIIRFRAPSSLKEKLEKIAATRTQDVSEYLRQRCLDIVADFEAKHPGFFAELKAAEDPSSYGHPKSPAAKTPRQKAKKRSRPIPPVPHPGETG
jgi:hypothetical protein